MRLLSRCLMLLALASALSVIHAADATDLAKRIADANGAGAWCKLKHLHFTWNHPGKDLHRTYDWNLTAGTVAVTSDGKTVTVPAAGAPAGATLPADQLAAHQGFINDSYWLLFPLHLCWDPGLTVSDLGTVPEPQFAALGAMHALSVQYPKQGGYTPGDQYVLYLDAHDQPLVWAFHKGGAAEATLVTTRAKYLAVGGLNLPTEFAKADGSVFISITGLAAE